MVALYTAATASAVLFLVFVYVLFRTLPFVPIFLAVLFTMFFANAAAPICLELASELTYPVGEETSATLLVVASMAVMVAFMLFADLISPVAMNWINAVRATMRLRELSFAGPRKNWREPSNQLRAPPGHAWADGGGAAAGARGEHAQGARRGRQMKCRDPQADTIVGIGTGTGS